LIDYLKGRKESENKTSQNPKSDTSPKTHQTKTISVTPDISTKRNVIHQTQITFNSGASRITETNNHTLESYSDKCNRSVMTVCFALTEQKNG
jgi:hypothetical protein